MDCTQFTMNYGGRVLRALVWGATKNLERAIQVAMAGGLVIAWGMILAGVLASLSARLERLLMAVGFWR